mmetsp:Transcript_15379/g.23391  ORF Transcript_15379/g.23391 Transcript_15379/m.23391 type:complete len:164 (+) Transcript_15379:179-670(+)|eukprot:CAMPEP_0178902818 /NCGR_PEP_ID=MMETSP0786-20121207/4817_1 /TAXON_ID=186022 /ORGANISM="Thalassionema frauenfeldii, Strain CCMP 1798" /LENGTH=163 /DNA_ID=CAMNT_0020574129 /DNA_START=53 /DNA_END=544 /DNA_ORIENTATION=+
MFGNNQLLTEVSSSVCDGLVCVGDETGGQQLQQQREETDILSDEELDHLFIPPPPGHVYWDSDRFSEDYGSDCDSSKGSISSQGSETSWDRMMGRISPYTNDSNKTKTISTTSNRRRKKGTSRKRLQNSYYTREEKNQNHQILLIPNISISQKVKQLESHISL